MVAPRSPPDDVVARAPRRADAAVKRDVVEKLQRGLARLEAVEPEIPLLANRPARVAHFRRLGSWLVEERLLLSMLGGRVLGRKDALPPRLAEASAARLLAALLFSPRWRARCRAQALLSKTRVRAFYGEPEPLTIKLVPNRGRSLEALARDVEARESAAGLGVPRLLAHCTDGPLPYLCEELLYGRHPDPKQDAAAVLAFVLGDLWERYRERGFAWKRCGDSHDLGALISNFEEMTEAMAWPERKALGDALRQLVEEAPKLVPWCHGHGDLSMGNMLISDGRMVLLDWERSRHLPLLVELAKIVIMSPETWAAVAARIREEFIDVPAPGMASLEAQGALASLERLTDMRTRFSATSPDALPSGSMAQRFERRLNSELAHLSRCMSSYRD